MKNSSVFLVAVLSAGSVYDAWATHYYVEQWTEYEKAVANPDQRISYSNPAVQISDYKVEKANAMTPNGKGRLGEAQEIPNESFAAESSNPFAAPADKNTMNPNRDWWLGGAQEIPNESFAAESSNPFAAPTDKNTMNPNGDWWPGGVQELPNESFAVESSNPFASSRDKDTMNPNGDWWPGGAQELPNESFAIDPGNPFASSRDKDTINQNRDWWPGDAQELPNETFAIDPGNPFAAPRDTITERVPVSNAVVSPSKFSMKSTTPPADRESAPAQVTGTKNEDNMTWRADNSHYGGFQNSIQNDENDRKSVSARANSFTSVNCVDRSLEAERVGVAGQVCIKRGEALCRDEIRFGIVDVFQGEFRVSAWNDDDGSDPIYSEFVTAKRLCIGKMGEIATSDFSSYMSVRVDGGTHYLLCPDVGLREKDTKLKVRVMEKNDSKRKRMERPENYYDTLIKYRRGPNDEDRLWWIEVDGKDKTGDGCVWDFVANNDPLLT